MEKKQVERIALTIFRSLEQNGRIEAIDEMAKILEKQKIPKARKLAPKKDYSKIVDLVVDGKEFKSPIEIIRKYQLTSTFYAQLQSGLTPQEIVNKNRSRKKK